MARFAYVNGRYLRHDAAMVHVEDRAFQFSDGVYEAFTIRDGQMLDLTGHLDRLDRSLAALRIAAPVTRPVLMLVLREIVRRNRIKDGLAYIQISRGVAPRDHAFPDPAPKPGLVITAKRIDPTRMEALVLSGVAVITLPDQRWARPDIKSVSLLANILAKQAAREAGAFEAWLVGPDGMVREGASTNAWIFGSDRILRTHPRGPILEGITRECLFACARAEGIDIRQEGFSVSQAQAADEAFLSSATTFVMPVISINGAPIGGGKPGPVAARLRQRYIDLSTAEAMAQGGGSPNSALHPDL